MIKQILSEFWYDKAATATLMYERDPGSFPSVSIALAVIEMYVKLGVITEHSHSEEGDYLNWKDN